MKKPTRAKGLGIDDAIYNAMLKSQEGHCALCPATPKSRRLNVDHDHKTGRVRALLCHRCNRALPSWVTPEWLDRAGIYLRDGKVAKKIEPIDWAMVEEMNTKLRKLQKANSNLRWQRDRWHELYRVERGRKRLR